MVRRSRTSAQALITPLRTRIPHFFEGSDDEQVDRPSSDPPTPDDLGSLEQGDSNLREDEDVGEDDAGSPANDSEAPSHMSTPIRGQSSIPRKRRAGRPPKVRTRDWDGPEEPDPRDLGSDVGTPRKRGGWRGRGFGVGRWGKPRGGPSHITQVPVDKEGNMANVKDDEVELPKDPDGETKVDKMGNLLGNREYRVRVFTISGKGARLYMLSTEPARCIGFRDSYLFFQKHRQLYKIILAEEAKRDLIERNIIPHSYKGRAIGVVTARSVFREFGARIVIGGRKIIDDYQVASARAQGDVEGEFAVPDDKLPGGGGAYDRNRYVAWHGASSVYHSGAPSIPLPIGKTTDGKKRKVIVTGINWMFEHAREASRFNATLAQNRRLNANGIYDTHTNIMQFPKTMQPTHARWEQLPNSLVTSKTLRRNSAEEGGASVTYQSLRSEGQDNDHAPVIETIFQDVPSVFSRNFMIADIYYTNPPLSGLGFPGPDEEVLDVNAGGLSHIPDQVLAELPDRCRPAFEEARSEEMKWKANWGGEATDRARGQLRISYNT